MMKYEWMNLGKFDHDLTVLPNPGIMVNKGNHPKIAQHFRFVNYYNLPRIMLGFPWQMFSHDDQVRIPSEMLGDP
jgi:hypothetical protein